MWNYGYLVDFYLLNDSLHHCFEATDYPFQDTDVLLQEVPKNYSANCSFFTSLHDLHLDLDLFIRSLSNHCYCLYHCLSFHLYLSLQHSFRFSFLSRQFDLQIILQIYLITACLGLHLTLFLCFCSKELLL